MPKTDNKTRTIRAPKDLVEKIKVICFAEELDSSELLESLLRVGVERRYAKVDGTIRDAFERRRAT